MNLLTVSISPDVETTSEVTDPVSYGVADDELVSTTGTSTAVSVYGTSTEEPVDDVPAAWSVYGTLTEEPVDDVSTTGAGYGFTVGVSGT